jgi:hypothetical protein
LRILELAVQVSCLRSRAAVGLACVGVDVEGVELTLAVVLITIAGIGSVEAGAAAVLYRGVTLWLPLLPGGAVVGAVLLGSAE